MVGFGVWGLDGVGWGGVGGGIGRWRVAFRRDGRGGETGGLGRCGNEFDSQTRGIDCGIWGYGMGWALAFIM